MNKAACLALIALLFFSCGKEYADLKDKISPDDPVVIDLGEGFAAIDLGLSVKWASANIGSEVPEGYGDYYAWGEIETKDNYNWNTYKWCDGSVLTKYNDISSYGPVDYKTVLDANDDIARVKLGGKWRLPTAHEVDELILTQNNDSYQWKWTSLNGHDGWLVTYLENNKSIFLPAAGCRADADIFNAGSIGNYWTSSHGTIGLSWGVAFESRGFRISNFGRFRGLTVRPVSE